MRSISRTAAIAALAVLCAVASRAASLEGKVLEVAADAVYLDRGGLDGMATGSQVRIAHGEAEPLALTVSAVADHYAVVRPAPAGGTLAAGDRWTLVGEPAAPADTLVKPSAPPEPAPDPALVAARWKEVLAAPQPLVPFKGEPLPRARAPRRTRVLASVLSYPTDVKGGGSYQGGRLDVRSSGGFSGRAGATYRIDMDLEGWGKRTDLSRLRPSKDPYLLVHDLAFAIAPPGGSYRATAGRFRAAQALAGPLIDGVAASLLGGAREFGAYGGLLPDPLDLRPDSKRAGFGAFALTSGTVSESLAARFGASIEARRFHGDSYETGRLLVALDRTAGVGMEAGAAAWRESSSMRFGDAHASIRGSKARGSYWLLYRESETAFDAKEREAFLDVFASAPDPTRRARRAEAGVSWARTERTRVTAVAGHAGGDGDLNRWIVEPSIEVRRGIWALRNWRIDYRGSFGWQEGHEADLGGLLAFGAWKLDLRLGGGALHQNKASRTTPLGRGFVDLRRGIGENGSISLTASGHGTNDFVGGAARLTFSTRF